MTLFRPQLPDEAKILRRGGREHIGAAHCGKLDRKVADAAGSGMDEDALALLQMPVLEQPLPGSHGGQWHGSSLVHAQGSGLQDAQGTRQGYEFGIGALRPFEKRHDFTLVGALLDDAGDIPAQSHGQVTLGDLRKVAFADLIVHGVDACGLDPQQHLARFWLGNVDLLDPQDLRPAETNGFRDCFHDGLIVSNVLGTVTSGDFVLGAGDHRCRI